MKNIIFDKVLPPLASRIGTLSAGALLATIYADTSLVMELGDALAAVLLIGFDLLMSRFFKKVR